MRAALQLFLFVTLPVSLIVAAALLLAIGRQPLIHRAAEITPESIGRASESSMLTIRAAFEPASSGPFS